MTLDDLVAQENYAGNHGSFSERHGEDTAPGVQLVEEHLNKGFGFLFRDQQEAEAFLGQKCHPAPLGNISKPKPGGGTKHRLIQNMKKNLVNRVSRVPERGVLPRPADHARDMSWCALRKKRKNQKKRMCCATLIIDYKDAFMTIPLHKNEQPFNCCQLPEGIRRDRAEAYHGEPKQ